jgi:hypothetical protein
MNVSRRRLFIEAGLVAGLVAGLAGLGRWAEERAKLGHTDAAGWRPFPWPFPPDAWPPGRAWSGDDHDVYVQLKTGLCGDCKTGVISDEAVDRAVDIRRLDPRFVPDGPGMRIRVTDLFGRARIYRHKRHNGSLRYAEGVVVSYKCDLIVAIIDGNVADPQLRKVGHAFLESNTPQVWVNKQLGWG